MFKVPNLKHSLDEDVLMRLMAVMPRSYLERGELTSISVKI